MYVLCDVENTLLSSVRGGGGEEDLELIVCFYVDIR